VRDSESSVSEGQVCGEGEGQKQGEEREREGEWERGDCDATRDSVRDYVRTAITAGDQGGAMTKGVVNYSQTLSTDH